jgi:DUF1365 family protein
MTCNSCIYEGRVRHRRHGPAPHAFSRRLFFMYVDLAEAATVFRGRWLWSASRPNLAWLRRRDHLFDRSAPLADEVRELVQRRTGRRPDGPIRLLTQFRYFGFLMNPISLFYCFSREERLEFVVAEVTNTPWNERHCYVLDVRSETRLVRTSQTPKLMHVSPFLPMDFEYRFRLTPPGRRLVVHVANCASPASRPPFDATLVLRRRSISPKQLRRVLVRYPFMTMQIFAAIYWQAFRLWRKGVPFFTHPSRRPVSGVPASP